MMESHDLTENRLVVARHTRAGRLPDLDNCVGRLLPLEKAAGPDPEERDESIGRNHPYTFVAVFAFVAVLAIATRADAKDNIKVQTARTIVATWKCQDKIPQPRTQAHSPWKPHSKAFRRWQLNLWTERLNRCRAILARSIPNTNDWVTAVKIVQRVYPGTKDWLLFISAREGGYGRFVMNHQGSGAGGWMQFMSSTYYAYNTRAYADVRRRGWRIDPRTNYWQHPLGQAITAGYMRYTGLDGCHWCL